MEKKTTAKRLVLKKQSVLKYFSALSIVVLTLIFYIINSSFLGGYNLKNLLVDSSPLLVMACGATFVIMLGSIDLSVGAFCSVANVLFVSLLPSCGALTYIIVALSGIVSGLLLGLVHVKIKIPSFIASLGFMSIWSSAALLINEAPVSIPKALRSTIDWANFSVGFLNVLILIALLIAVLFYWIQTRTGTGRSVLAIGGNERTARLAGIAVDRTKIMAFMLCGLCSALGGILLAVKLKSAAPTVGEPFTLLVIASVALGGTALDGGKGSLIGTILGVFLVTVIQNGLNIIGVDAFWQQIVFGIVVIFAVALTVDRTRRNLVVK